MAGPWEDFQTPTAVQEESAPWNDFKEEGAINPWDDYALNDFKESDGNKQFKRDELAKQTFQARLEGEQAKALTGLTDIGTEAAKAVVRAASHVDPTGFTQGLMQQYGVEPTHVIPPEVVLEDVKTVSQFARQGLGNLGVDSNVIIPEQYRKPAEEFVAETIASTPEMAPLLAAGTVAPRAVGRVFQAQMLQGVPQTAYQAFTAPTAEERIKAGIQTGAGLAFPALIERGMRTPTVPIPDFIGRQLEMQRGAIPPRGEPVAPIERVTPEQAAIAAERMSAPFDLAQPYIGFSTSKVEPATMPREPRSIREAWLSFEKSATATPNELVLVAEKLMEEGNAPGSLRLPINIYKQAMEAGQDPALAEFRVLAMIEKIAKETPDEIPTGELKVKPPVLAPEKVEGVDKGVNLETKPQYEPPKPRIQPELQTAEEFTASEVEKLATGNLVNLDERSTKPISFDISEWTNNSKREAQSIPNVFAHTPEGTDKFIIEFPSGTRPKDALESLVAAIKTGDGPGESWWPIAHIDAIKQAAKQGNPLSAISVEQYGIKLPRGYVKDGGVYRRVDSSKKGAKFQSQGTTSVEPPKPEVAATIEPKAESEVSKSAALPSVGDRIEYTDTIHGPIQGTVTKLTKDPITGEMVPWMKTSESGRDFPAAQWYDSGKIVEKATQQPTPKPTETPVEAAGKVEAEVKSVAQTEGVRSAKEIKSELVQRLEKAIDDAPNKADVPEYSKQAKSYKESITIEIPEDGTFTVPNTKEHLGEVLARAKRISTTAGTPSKTPVFRTSTPIGEQAEAIIKAYGNAESAYQTAKRQRDSLQSQEPPRTAEERDAWNKQIENAEYLMRELHGRTKAGIIDAKIEGAETILRDAEQSASQYENEVQKLQNRPTKRKLTPNQQVALNQTLAFSERAKESLVGARKKLIELQKEKTALEQQPAQPIPQGPGAQTAPKQTVEAPESYSGTALKNAVADIERAGWGMAEAPEHIRQAIPEAWIRAGRTLERDPMAGQKLVDELQADPKGRGLSVDESALLLRQKVILTNEMNAAAEGIHTAKTPLDKARAEANYDWAHEKMLTMLDAIKNRGTAWGQEGRWRQVMAREDFSLATLVTQREAALGKKILPGSPEFAELKKHADRLQELNAALEKRVSDVEKEFQDSEVKRALAEAQANANKELPYHPRILELAEGYAKKWDARGAKALADLKEMFGEGMAFSGAPISPAMLDKAIIYGTSKMVRGAVDLAKWTDAMIKDLGEGFRKYARDIYDASKKAFDQDVVTDFKKPDVVKKVKGALQGPDLGTETILKKIAAKSAKTPEGRLPNINYYLRKLGRVYAREGIKEEGPFLDRMTADVQKVIPNLTRDDVRAIFGGYAEEVRALSKEPVEVILRDMRGQAQELHKLSLLKQKIIPPKLQERATPSEKQRQLRKQVEAEKRTGGFAPPDPEMQLRSAMQSAETRLTNQIADLTREIESGEKIVQQKRAPLQSEKLDALRARRDALREIHDEVFKKPDLTDSERLEIWKERTKEQIDELRERRRIGDFKPKPKPDPIRFDKQAIELQFLKEVEHRALMEMRAKDELSKRTTPEVVKDSLKNAAMFAHMAMAGGEFSAVFKQGATGAYSMPIRTARNFAKSLEAWWSEENQFKIKHEILTRDNAPMYRRDKLEFTDVGGRLSSMEEMYMFRVMDWMKKVPGLSHYVRYMDRFQRAFSTFLNLMRADTYDAMVKEMGSSPEAGQSAANYINVATGRGSHSTARFGGAGANAIFFAPRWSISRFQYLLGQPILAAKPGYKKYIVKQYGKTLLGLGSVYALGYAMGGDVDWNPTSSKFGKIQIGNRVIDPLFGLAPVMRIIAQQVTGLRKNSRGQIRPIREGGKLPVFENMIQGSRKLGPYDPSGAELMGKFAWSKLAPAPEATVSAATGENVIGEKFSVGQKLGQLVTPITYRDVFNAIKDEGVDEKTAIDLMAIFGLSSYVEKPKTSKPNW